MFVRAVSLVLALTLGACAPPSLRPQPTQIAVYTDHLDRYQAVQQAAWQVNAVSPCKLFSEPVNRLLVDIRWTQPMIAVIFMHEDELRVAADYDPDKDRILLGYYWQVGHHNGLIAINVEHPADWPEVIMHELGHALGLDHGSGVMEAREMGQPLKWSDRHYQQLKEEKCLILVN